MMYETAAAPSPIVPTTPSQLPRKKRLGMSAMTSKLSTATPTRYGSLHRNQRRPSEASIKSTRNQNVLDLLRGSHSQSPDASSQTVASVEGGGGGGALEVLKAGHRRLLQFAQRKTATASRQETTSQQTDDSTRPDSKQNGRNSPSQESLGETVGTKSDIDIGGRLGTLDFGDFGDFIAMLSPPPYETPSPSQHSRDATPPPANQGSVRQTQQPFVRRQPSDETIVIGMREIDINEKPTVSPAPEITEDNSAERPPALQHTGTGQHRKAHNDGSGQDQRATENSRASTSRSATTLQPYPQSITSHPRTFAGSDSLAPQRVSSKNALRSLDCEQRTPKADDISPTPSTSSPLASKPGGTRPRLSSDTQSSGVASSFSTVSSSPERSVGSREKASEKMLLTSSRRDRKDMRLMSSPLETIPAFPLPPPTMPLPPLPKLPLVDQNQKAKASKMSSQMNPRYLHAQRFFAASQQSSLPTPNSSRAQTPEMESVSSSRSTRDSPNSSLGEPVGTTKHKISDASLTDMDRNGPGQACTLRLKDMTDNCENREYLEKEKDYSKEDASPTPAEWLVFPPLSSSKANVVPPFRPRDIKIGTDVAPQTCPPKYTGARTFRTDSLRNEGVCRETATNVSSPEDRPESPAPPSLDVEHLSPDSWSYCSYDSPGQSSMKAQEHRIPRATAPSDGSSITKDDTPPIQFSPLSLESGSPQLPEKVRLQRQHTVLSNGAPRSQQSLKLRSLESRVSQLENQNKILRAALFATFDIGSRLDNTGRLRGFHESESSSSSPRLKPSPSLPLMSNPSIRNEVDPVMKIAGNGNSQTKKQPLENGDRSAGDGVRDSFETMASSASIREMEDMMVNLDIDWMAEGLS